MNERAHDRFPSLRRRWRRWSMASAMAAGLCAARIATGAGTSTLPAGWSATIAVTDLAGATVFPLADQGQKAVVFFFVLHDCPIANGYAPEISRITAEYAAKGVRCFVVYAENDLTPEQARQHASEYGYKSGALLDPQHLLVKAAGATVSPEAAVLSPSGEILYRGRIDDRAVDLGKRRAEPTQRDLRLALGAILAGSPVAVRFTKAVGCYIP